MANKILMHFFLSYKPLIRWQMIMLPLHRKLRPFRKLTNGQKKLFIKKIQKAMFLLNCCTNICQINLPFLIFPMAFGKASTNFFNNSFVSKKQNIKTK